jgi:hypothetical protein
MNANDERRLVEKVEVLDGSRSAQRRRAAVRIDDLSALFDVADRLQAVKAAGATPTKAEFDALVDDIGRLRAQLYRVMEALQARIL